MQTYKGIDYGMGQTNIDHSTGIRFGVISMYNVDYWNDYGEAVYDDYCPNCEKLLNDDEKCEKECSSCGKVWDEREFDCNEPSYFHYDQQGYKIFQDYDDCDLFVELSPFFTYAAFCSPCAPGACHLENEMDVENGEKCYCLGHDWFENGAPYTVYSCETGKKVEKC